MSKTDAFSKMRLTENEVREKFILFVDEVVATRPSRGGRSIRQPQVFVRKMLDLLDGSAAQRARRDRITASSKQIASIQKLARALRSELVGLDRVVQEALFGTSDFSSLCHEMDDLSRAAAALQERKKGAPTDFAVHSIAKSFVIMCIDHDWLPISVSNSAEAAPTRHQACLAMLLDAAGLFSKIDRADARSNHASTKARSALRMLRDGFEYVAHAPDIDELSGADYLYRASFAGGQPLRSIKDFSPEFWDDEPDELASLPKFSPPDT